MTIHSRKLNDLDEKFPSHFFPSLSIYRIIGLLLIMRAYCDNLKIVKCVKKERKVVIYRTRNNDFIKRSKRNDVKFGLCFAPVSGSFPRKSSGYNNLLCCRERSQTWISPIFTGCEQTEIRKSCRLFG